MAEVIFQPRIIGDKLSKANQLFARVGGTPMLPLQRIDPELPEEVRIWAKAEWFNPAGSVKDRPASGIIRAALRDGRLGRGQTLLDSTSGNMGIAYASFGAALGIPVRLAIPGNAGRARLAVLQALGAELIITDPSEGSDGAREVARRIADHDPERFYYADQYSNPANWQAHFASTGPEILAQTEGRLTHFVSGLGTTGTLTGVGRFLREHAPGARLIAVQPDGPMHGLEGLKHLPSSHVPAIYDPTLPDEIAWVSTDEAYAMARRLAHVEGLLVGLSSAAATVAALRIAQAARSAKIIVLFPDSGMKYLDLPFWGEA
jgi:cysteine synthase B